MNNKMYVPKTCFGCGAPLPESLVCEYCNTRHERTQRYIGPDIVLQGDPNFNYFMGNIISSTAIELAVSTNQTWLPSIMP